MEYNEENLIKFYADGLSYTEIGETFGKSRSAVAGRIRRLKTKHPTLLLPRDCGVHPQGKTYGPKPKPKSKKIAPNKYTVMTKPMELQDFTKNQLREMLKQAVENTK